MPQLKEIHDELDFVSDRISTQVRTIALSVLALVWLFLAGGKGTPALPAAPGRPWLLGVAAVIMAVLVADYLQYLFGYLATNAIRVRAEASGNDAADFDYRDPRYRLRAWLFWCKQVLALVAVIGLAVAIIKALLA
jgi:hypothetical protein